jgi:NAD(P)-dependent dehydrogenase (short-subunit alcohol dehydrogenase family)
MNDFLKLISLDGKVSIVTGASKGLGASFAEMLALAGSDVVITCRHFNDLEATAGLIRKSGRKVLKIECDITDEDQVKSMTEQTVGEFGKIDVLVNNAATGRVNISPQETTLEQWSSVIRTNVTGPFLCSREVGKTMIKQRKGKIINIASMSGRIINKYFHGGSYDVSKSSVAALTKALAVEWAPYNINVFAVAPGYYYTDPNRKWFEKNTEIYEKVTDMIPLKKLGDIRELGGLIACLASDITNYMTGSTILIDGGYTIW